MTLPKFLCIGAQKAGTSWLFAQLQSHPQVWMPPVKELQFFNHLFVPQNRNWTTWHIRHSTTRAMSYHLQNTSNPDLSYIRYLADLGSQDLFTERWYRAAFDRPAARQKLLGDITPEYSTVPEAGIQYIRSLLGAVKIIYLIRDPLSRALSQFRMNISRKNVDVSESGLLEMADQWDLANRGDYKTYVPRWKKHFSENDILFLPYGRIRRDPAGLMKEVEAFLGLPPLDYPRSGEEIHSTQKMKIPEPVVDKIRTRLAGQNEFLEAEFGSEFFKAT